MWVIGKTFKIFFYVFLFYFAFLGFISYAFAADDILGDVYHNQCAQAATNYSDSTTYYFCKFNVSATTAGGINSYPVNVTSTIWGVGYSYTGLVDGSSEEVANYIRVESATGTVDSYYVGSTTMDNITGTPVFLFEGLSIPLGVGDQYEMEIRAPAWATNPLAVIQNVSLGFSTFSSSGNGNLVSLQTYPSVNATSLLAVTESCETLNGITYCYKSRDLYLTYLVDIVFVLIGIITAWFLMQVFRKK